MSSPLWKLHDVTLFLLSDSIKEDHNGGSETHFCRLRHPKSGKISLKIKKNMQR